MMTTHHERIACLVIAAALLASSAAAACAPDAVAVGDLCVDRYEASVWKIVPANTALIAAVKNGTASGADLTAGGLRRGETGDDYAVACPDDGTDCTKLYATSIPGVKPSRYLTWFQALAACRNAGKRLLTSGEWQMAALGTDDNPAGLEDNLTNCNIVSNPGLDPTNTGSRSACVSNAGAYDMVGNLAEWVADWDEAPNGTETWLTGDLASIGGDGTDTHQPMALVRGGSYLGAIQTGPFTITASSPSIGGETLGFRCAR